MAKLNENIQKLQIIVESITQDPSVEKETKVNMIIHATSLICAIVAVQPLPFADIMILTPIQLIMVTGLNKIMGNPFEKSSLKDIVASLMGVVGWGTLAQHTILGLYKTVIPFYGGVTTIPLVYAFTFALGIGAKILIEAKKNDQQVSDAEIKHVMEKAKQDAHESQRKLSVSESIEQINQLLKDANKYAQYKENLLAMDRVIREKYDEDISMQTDINNLILKRKQAISRRISEKYINVKMNDYIYSMLAILDSKFFIEKVEPIIAQICFDMSKMDCISSHNYGKGKFFEIETEVGTLVVKRQKRNEIISFDFADDIKINSLLKYMSFDMPGNSEIKKDDEIGICFRNIIKEAKEYVYIVSPWVGKKPYEVVSKLMEEALKRNDKLQIKVLYGYQDQEGYSSNADKLKNSRTYINKYQTRIGKAFKAKETNTHVKLVLCDDKCFLIGSMNYLSFLGDYSNVEGDELRHEVAMLSYDQEMLKELKEAYFNWD